MPRITTILTLAVLCFLQVSSHAEDSQYVPAHNLIPISYNPLTINYNPDYDHYPGLMAKQSQGESQIGFSYSGAQINAKESQIAELQAKLQQLKQQRNENTKSLMSGSLGDMMTRSVQGNQLNSEIQNLEDRLTTLMTGQAPVRVTNQASPRRSINCYTYGLGNAFTTCN